MSGYGTGFPNFFRCPQGRRDNQFWRASFDTSRARPHWVTLTGRTRPTRPGKGHPRKSWTTWEWRCSCGATGWSSHKDLERAHEAGKDRIDAR